jgi:hypothetical protein
VLQSILVPNQIYDYYENTTTIARNKGSKPLGLFQDAHNEKTYFSTLVFLSTLKCEKDFKLSHCPMGVLKAKNYLPTHLTTQFFKTIKIVISFVTSTC